LTDNEKDIARKILVYMKEEDLGSLADTCCKKLVVHHSWNEAVDIILEFSTDLKQFLTRQKILRDCLFKFAVIDNKLKCDLNATKETLIRCILKHARATDVGATDPDHDVGDSQHDAEPRQTTSSPSLDVNAMAVQFAAWFYPILNRCTSQPRLTANETPSSTSSDFGSHHFLPNCSLHLRLERGGDQILESHRGADVVADRLKKQVLVDGLLFSPNDTIDGCRGMQEPHGLVLLDVKGTLLQKGCLVGVFQQQFGLVKDPSSDNWKIQVTHLTMRAGNQGTALPADGQAKRRLHALTDS